jgi:hypothetical protein
MSTSVTSVPQEILEDIFAPVHRSSVETQKQNRTPCFLWGIMTTDSDNDRKRRQVIRNTYLSYYKTDEENKHRICSISDLMAGQVPVDSCQIAYTFVVGGNPNGTTDLVDTDHHGKLTTIPPNSSAMEEDVTYLNIRENMNEGKTQSWFKYATSLEVPFDYVAKVDSDTLLLPPRFLSFFQSLPQNPLKNHVYAGDPFDSKKCGNFWWCNLQGPIYMGGGLYILSASLVKHIVSPELNRTDLLVPREDVAIGNLVYSSPFSVATVSIFRTHKLWEHNKNLKGLKGYQKRWEQVMKTWLANPPKPEW